MVCAVSFEAVRASACCKLRNYAPSRAGRARCLTVRAVDVNSVDKPVNAVTRRHALQSFAVLLASGIIPDQVLAAGKSAEVGRYLFEFRVIGATPTVHRLLESLILINRLAAATYQRVVSLAFLLSSPINPKLR